MGCIVETVDLSSWLNTINENSHICTDINTLKYYAAEELYGVKNMEVAGDSETFTCVVSFFSTAQHMYYLYLISNAILANNVNM